LASQGAVAICRADEACFPELTARATTTHALQIDGQNFVLFLLRPQ
jgi:hypothetical protein